MAQAGGGGAMRSGWESRGKPQDLTHLHAGSNPLLRAHLPEDLLPTLPGTSRRGTNFSGTPALLGIAITSHMPSYSILKTKLRDQYYIHPLTDEEIEVQRN